MGTLTSKAALLAAAIHAETSVVASVQKTFDFFKSELKASSDLISQLKDKLADDETELAERADDHVENLDDLLAELGSNNDLLTASVVANTPVAAEVSPASANQAAVSASDATQSALASAGSTGSAPSSTPAQPAGSTGSTGGSDDSSSGDTGPTGGTGSTGGVTPFDSTAAGGQSDSVISPGESPGQNFRTNADGSTSNPEQVGSSALTQGGGQIDNSKVPTGTGSSTVQVASDVSPIPSSAASGDGMVNGTNVPEAAQPGTSTLEPPAPGAGPADGLQPENNAAVTPGQAGIDAGTKPSAL